MLKIKLLNKFYEFINSNESINDRKLCFNPIVLNIFNRFVYKSISLPVHILVIDFKVIILCDIKLSLTFDRNMT